MAAAHGATIRALQTGDQAQFGALMTMFGEAFSEVETYTARRPGRDYVAKLLSRDDFIALAAFDGDEVVGGLAAYVLHKFEQERSEVFVYDLAVAEPYRRRGIATALLEELRAIASGRGAYVMFIQADKGDTAPINLYSKLGTREEALNFDIEVPKRKERDP